MSEVIRRVGTAVAFVFTVPVLLVLGTLALVLAVLDDWYENEP